MTSTKTKKTICTKSELELAKIIGFKGKYLVSLIESAHKHCKLNGDKLPDAKSYLKEIDRQHADRVKFNWNMTPRKYKDLQAKARSILNSFRTGYSMGEEKILAVDGKHFCCVDNRRDYSGGCKYQPKHGEFTIRLKMHELRTIEKIEGVWTIRRKGTAASWLRSQGSKGSYKVEFFDGHVVGTSHGATIAECNSLESEKQRMKVEASAEAIFLNRFVGFDDRRIVGACRDGVAAFCERHNLNVEFGYRIDYLISLGDETAKRFLDRLSRNLNRRKNYGIE